MAAPSNEPGDEPTDEQAPAQTAAAEAAETASAPAEVDDLTTETRSITASVQLIWALRALAGVVVLGVFASLGADRVGLDRGVVVAGAAVLAVLLLVWVHLRYRVWSYRIRDDALYLERGVVTNVKTVAPHVRIQHVDTQRGPLQRALGLSTLVVYTAGSRGADVAIPGLRTDVAADLQSRVKELAIESEGGDAL
jgi:membrane protein YdbS with pleckstrin-like domain